MAKFCYSAVWNLNNKWVDHNIETKNPDDGIEEAVNFFNETLGKNTWKLVKIHQVNRPDAEGELVEI